MEAETRPIYFHKCFILAKVNITKQINEATMSDTNGFSILRINWKWKKEQTTIFEEDFFETPFIDEMCPAVPLEPPVFPGLFHFVIFQVFFFYSEKEMPNWCELTLQHLLFGFSAQKSYLELIIFCWFTIGSEPSKKHWIIWFMFPYKNIGHWWTMITIFIWVSGRLVKHNSRLKVVIYLIFPKKNIEMSYQKLYYINKKRQIYPLLCNSLIELKHISFISDDVVKIFHIQPIRYGNSRESNQITHLLVESFMNNHDDLSLWQNVEICYITFRMDEQPNHVRACYKTDAIHAIVGNKMP